MATTTMKTTMRLPSATTTTTRSSCASSWPIGPRGARQQQRNVIAAASSDSTTSTTTTSPSAPQSFARAALAAVAATAASSLLLFASPAIAANDVDTNTTTTNTTQPTTTVYFGNGCFWGRQKDFVETEMRTLQRPPQQVTAVAGYAAGAQGTGPGGKVCYHFNDPRQVYERLGHAEVVAVELDGDLASTTTQATTQKEMRAFSKTYWSQFRRLRDGRLQRLDPQDSGPGYRNVVGLPGGINSPLFDVLLSLIHI
jgi:peptide methionine sulfoxide reductase MsrA